MKKIYSALILVLLFSGSQVSAQTPNVDELYGTLIILQSQMIDVLKEDISDLKDDLKEADKSTDSDREDLEDTFSDLKTDKKELSDDYTEEYEELEKNPAGKLSAGLYSDLLDLALEHIEDLMELLEDYEKAID